MPDLTFIETQFPVSKLSKESYKERKANNSQTLTGLGKWWGRKPLVLIRAALLGLLMPASDDPKKDREIFLKLMTMDEEGLWRRVRGNISCIRGLSIRNRNGKGILFYSKGRQMAVEKIGEPGRPGTYAAPGLQPDEL